MPGPLDGLIPSPKEMGDWLEEVFGGGKGTNPNGPKGPGDNEGKDDGGPQGKRKGPSVEDLYPKKKMQTAGGSFNEMAFSQNSEAF